MNTSLKNQIKVVAAPAKTKQGLTIVESLVAISILVIAVLGPLVIISQALKTAFFARDQMTAFFLAQEAIEYVRNKRDFNALTQADPADWLNNIATAAPTSPPVITDIDGGGLAKYNMTRGTSGYELQQCPGNICPKLDRSVSTGVYGETQGTVAPSIYTREIVFYKAPGDDLTEQEITIEVNMSWAQVGGVYEFSLRENLTNWKIQDYSVN